MILQIKDKQIFDELGTVKDVAKSVELNISYTVGENDAKGFFKFINTHGATISNGNKRIPTNGWGQDDSIMIDRFLTILKCDKKN